MARRLVLATSLVDVQPDIEHFAPFVGTSVFHCPLCDAATFADRPVVVISWGAKAAGSTLGLSHWTQQLTLVTHGHPIDEGAQARLARHGVRVRTERVQRLAGQDGLVTGVVLVGGATVRCDAVFFNIAHRPRNELARALGCALEPEGYVKVDEHYQTTVPHVYAAGDITAREESVADAVAEGFMAAAHLHLSLYPEL
jgi:thioredoxin reductase